MKTAYTIFFNQFRNATTEGDALSVLDNIATRIVYDNGNAEEATRLINAVVLSDLRAFVSTL